MRPEKVIAGYNVISRVFSGTRMSSTYDVVKIPYFPLPSQYNKPSTALLIRIEPYSDYTTPEGYVDRGLRIRDSYGGDYICSLHLDEALTPQFMLRNGWVKICIKDTEWGPHYNLVDFLQLCIEFLRRLHE